MDIFAQAKELGAVIYGGSLCLPARSLATFLRAAMNMGAHVLYVECLYFYEQEGSEPSGTEPSMELSRGSDEFADSEAFLADVGVTASEAMKRADRKGVRAFFQIGFNPDPDLAGCGIEIRPYPARSGH
jgi:hypothetical protein